MNPPFRVEYTLDRLLAFARLADAQEKRDGQATGAERRRAIEQSTTGGFEPIEAEAYACLLAHPSIDGAVDKIDAATFGQLPEGNPAAICPAVTDPGNPAGLQHRLRLWRAQVGATGMVEPYRFTLPPHDEIYLLVINGDPDEERHRNNVASMLGLWQYLGVPAANMYVASSAYTDAYALGIHTAPGTVDGIEHQLQQMNARDPGKRKLLILYTTGHGDKEGEVLSMALENHQRYSTKTLAERLGASNFSAIRSISDQCFSGPFPDYLVTALPKRDIIAMTPNTQTVTVVCGEWTPDMVRAMERGIDLDGSGTVEFRDSFNIAMAAFNRHLQKNKQQGAIGSYRQSVPALTEAAVPALFRADAGDAIVELTAPWCEVCHQMEKEFDNVRVYLPESIGIHRVYDVDSPEGRATVLALRQQMQRQTAATGLLGERLSLPGLIYLRNGRVLDVSFGYKDPSALRTDFQQHFGVAMDDGTRRLRLAEALERTHGVPTDYSLDYVDKQEPEIIAAAYTFSHGTDPGRVARAAQTLGALSMREFPYQLTILDSRFLLDRLARCEEAGDRMACLRLTARIFNVYTQNNEDVDAIRVLLFEQIGTRPIEEQIAVIEGLALHRSFTIIGRLLEHNRTATEPRVRAALIRGMASRHLQKIEPLPGVATMPSWLHVETQDGASMKPDSDPAVENVWHPELVQAILKRYPSQSTEERLAILESAAALAHTRAGAEVARVVLSWSATAVNGSPAEWEAYLRTARANIAAHPQIAGQDVAALDRIGRRVAAELDDGLSHEQVMERLRYMRMVRLQCPHCAVAIGVLANNAAITGKDFQLVVSILPQVTAGYATAWQELALTRPNDLAVLLEGIMAVPKTTLVPAIPWLIRSGLQWIGHNDRRIRHAAYRLLATLDLPNRLTAKELDAILNTMESSLFSSDYVERTMAAQILANFCHGNWSRQAVGMRCTDVQLTRLKELFFTALEDPSDRVVQSVFTPYFMLTGGQFLAETAEYLPYSNPAFVRVFAQQVLSNPRVMKPETVDQFAPIFAKLVARTKSPEVAAEFVEACRRIAQGTSPVRNVLQPHLTLWVETIRRRTEISAGSKVSLALLQWGLLGRTPDEIVAMTSDYLASRHRIHPQLCRSLVNWCGLNKQAGVVPALFQFLKTTKDPNSHLTADVLQAIASIRGLRAPLSPEEHSIIRRILVNSRTPHVVAHAFFILLRPQNLILENAPVIFPFLDSPFSAASYNAKNYFYAVATAYTPFTERVKSRVINGHHYNRDIQYLARHGEWEFLGAHLGALTAQENFMWHTEPRDWLGLTMVDDKALARRIIEALKTHRTHYVGKEALETSRKEFESLVAFIESFIAPW